MRKCNCVKTSILVKLPELPESYMRKLKRKSGRRCQVTGKKSSKRRSTARSGIAKSKGGIGLNHVKSIVCKKRFRPNVRKKRIWDSERGCFVTLRISSNGQRILDKNNGKILLSSN